MSSEMVFSTSSICSTGSYGGMLVRRVSICSIGACGETVVRPLSICLIGASGGMLVRTVSICSIRASGGMLVRPISICSISRSVDIRRANTSFGQTFDQLLKHPINMMSLKMLDVIDTEVVLVLFSVLVNVLVDLFVRVSVWLQICSFTLLMSLCNKALNKFSHIFNIVFEHRVPSISTMLFIPKTKSASPFDSLTRVMISNM